MKSMLNSCIRGASMVGLTFVLCGLFSYYFAVMRMSHIPEYELVTIDKLVAGTAPAPYQYRVLMPWLIGTLQGAQFLSNTVGTAKGYCFGIEMGATFGLFVAMWAYFGCFFNDFRVKALGMLFLMYALSMTYLVPKGFVFYYVYDIPAACLFTMGLLLLYRQKMICFYALFVVATLNRETSCFLAMALLLTNWQRSKQFAIGHCLVLAMIWLAIKAAIAQAYNLQGFYEWTFLNNFKVLSSPFDLFQVLSAIGMLWLFAMLGWRSVTNLFLRQVCLVGFIFFLGMFCVANVHEIRVYGELIPVFLPAALTVIASLFRDSSVPESR